MVGGPSKNNCRDKTSTSMDYLHKHQTLRQNWSRFCEFTAKDDVPHISLQHILTKAVTMVFDETSAAFYSDSGNHVQLEVSNQRVYCHKKH